MSRRAPKPWCAHPRVPPVVPAGLCHLGCPALPGQASSPYKVCWKVNEITQLRNHLRTLITEEIEEIGGKPGVSHLCMAEVNADDFEAFL